MYRNVTDSEIINYLAIDCGFSRRNAETAVQLYKETNLTPNFLECFDRLYYRTPEGAKLEHWGFQTGNKLNYLITTEYGGVAAGGKN